MPYTVQFVDSVASSPTVRLDINDGAIYWVSRKPSADLSPPKLKRVVVSTYLRDGDRVPSTAYENRVLRFRLGIQGSSEDDLATKLQALNRELDRATNVLKWQSPSATNPVFFKTFRSPDYRLNIDSEIAFRLWAELEIVARPFAWGLQETAVGPVNVNNDPAAGSNPQYVDIVAANVKGDVLTPAYIQTKGPIVANVHQLLAVRRHGTPSHIILQCESMTNQTDTATQADAAFSGGSGKRTTFASTTTMTARASTSSWPRVTPTIDDRGVYRVFIRQRRSTAGDVIKARWRLVAPSGVTGPTVQMPATADLGLVDLGLMQLPAVADPVHDGASETQWAFAAQQFYIDCERTSGSGTWDFDYVLLVPADEGLAIASENTALNDWLWDGENDVVRSINGSSVLANFGVVGGIPHLAPNQVNRLFYLYRIGPSTGFGDDKAAANSITVKYWPRWLYVRP